MTNEWIIGTGIVIGGGIFTAFKYLLGQMRDGDSKLHERINNCVCKDDFNDFKNDIRSLKTTTEKTALDVAELKGYLSNNKND